MPRSRPSAAAAGPILGIDLLRFSAALCVMWFHYAWFAWNVPLEAIGLSGAIGEPARYPELVPFSSWGWVGVEVFFVISGYVIALSAIGASAARFLRSRLLRLAPALWFFVTLTFLVTLSYTHVPFDEVATLYVKSMLLDPRGGSWLDGVLWTLTVEVAFYGCIFLLLLAGRPHWLEPMAFLLAAVGLLFWTLSLIDRAGIFAPWASQALEMARDRHMFKVGLLTTGSYFAAGMLLFLIHRAGTSPWRQRMLAAALAGGTIGIWFEAVRLDWLFGHGQSPLVPCLVWLLAVVLVHVAVVRAADWQARLAPGAVRLIRLAGLATYPLYLFHAASGAYVFGVLLRAGLDRFAALGLALLFSIAVAVLFTILLEQRLRGLLAALYDAIGSAFAAVFSAAAGARSAASPDKDR